MVLLYMEYSMYAVVVSNVVQQCAPSLMLSLRSEGEAKCPCSPKASCPLGCGLNKTQHWCRGELEWPQPILYFNAFDTIPCLTCISFLGHSGGTDQYMLRIFGSMQSEGFDGVPSVKDGVAESAAAGVQDVGRIPHLPIG